MTDTDNNNPVLETIKLVAAAEALRLVHASMGIALQKQMIPQRNYSIEVDIKITERIIATN
jgi:hypothetical protein